MHKYNSFLTLTYETKNIPEILDKETGEIMTTINPDHWTLFMKSLRKHLSRHGGEKVSYYMSAEYGADTNRPHFHSILFGFQANRKNLEIINGIWHKGFVSLLPVLDGGAEYVAKHQNKDELPKSTFCVNPYHSCSTRPAIGVNYIKQNEGRVQTDLEKFGTIGKLYKLKLKWQPLPRIYLEKLYGAEYVSAVKKQKYKKFMDKYLKYFKFETYKNVDEWLDYQQKIKDYRMSQISLQRFIKGKRRNKV
jgi:hypothetical protein